MAKTITQLPEATSAQASAVVAADNAAGTLTEKVTLGQIAALAAVQSVAGRIGAVTLAKADVGLSNVDNTSDANKPVSTAVQAALDGKAASSHTHPAANITGLATVAKTGAYADLTGAPGLKAVRIDSSATTTVYVGKAATGTAGNAPGWTINRFGFSPLGVLQITSSATGIWDNRTSLIYS